MTNMEGYFFDDPGYWRSQEDEPHVQGFIDIRPEVAAIIGIHETTKRTKVDTDPGQIHEEGEQ